MHAVLLRRRLPCSQRAENHARCASSTHHVSLTLITPNHVRATALLVITKRAETRECSACGDHTPLRLLGQHFTLESVRVQNHPRPRRRSRRLLRPLRASSRTACPPPSIPKLDCMPLLAPRPVNPRL
jgi:hypothetical protein